MRKRNNRIVFYLNDEELAALTNKVQKSKFTPKKRSFTHRNLTVAMIIVQ